MAVVLQNLAGHCTHAPCREMSIDQRLPCSITLYTLRGRQQRALLKDANMAMRADAANLFTQHRGDRNKERALLRQEFGEFVRLAEDAVDNNEYEAEFQILDQQQVPEYRRKADESRRAWEERLKENARGEVASGICFCIGGCTAIAAATVSHTIEVTKRIGKDTARHIAADLNA